MKLLAFLPSLLLFAGAVTAAGTSSVRGKRGFQHRRLSTAMTAHDLVVILKGEASKLSKEIKLFKDELDLAKGVTDTAESEAESSGTFTITADEYLPLMDMEIDLLRHEITFLQAGLKVIGKKLPETSKDPTIIELKELTELVGEDIAVLNDELNAIDADMDLILGLSEEEAEGDESG
jgi:trehalose/maltose hydrolase-like predicted phosphorylase